MNVIGVVCEYNPMHLGHLYQIEQVKKTWGKYNDIIDKLVFIVDNLPKEERQKFVRSIYNSKTNNFNETIIKKEKEIINGINISWKSNS